MNNTFLELAQGFQAPVHTYNSYITGEYQTKFENNTKDVYIYRKGSRVYKYTSHRIHSIQKYLIQHVYTKKFIIQYVWKEKYTLSFKKIHSSCPAQRKGYSHYSTWGGKEREWWVIALLSEWIIHIHRIGSIWNQIIRYPQNHSFNTKKII